MRAPNEFQRSSPRSRRQRHRRAGGVGIFFILVGKSSSSIWPYNAVHNWEQYGFTALHGKLVLNPGGHEALAHPDTYKGHRPAAYYPVLLTGKLLGWLGDSLLIYHALFSVALFFGVWFLLGRGPLALVGGFAAALCPGYAVYSSVVDPNAMALYMVVPYAAVLVNFLTAKELPPLRLIVQFLILGVMGEFIARIYNEVKQRPRWIIREMRGVEMEKQ